MRKCSKCGELKTIESFNKSSNRKDGLHIWCRSCVTLQKRERRARDREEQQRARLEMLEAGYKVCCICKEALPLENFSAASKHSDGRSSRCKSCDKEYKRKHYIENKARIDAKNKKWREENRDYSIEKSRERYYRNKDRHLEYCSAYRKENKEYIRAWKKKHYTKNRERILDQQKRYREKNIEPVKESNRRYYWENRDKCLERAKGYRENNRERINASMLRRYKECPQHNIKMKSRNYINKCLQRAELGTRKHDSTIKLLGCSYEDFKVHIERQFTKGMTWSNFLAGEIHLDHIRPTSSFDLTDPEQQAEAFHYLNVMPLWAKDNMRKSDKITHLL